MKNLRLSAALAMLVLLGSAAHATGHWFGHVVAGFADAWNAHDTAAMELRWAADATAIDPLGRTAHGRTAVAQLFVGGTSQIRITAGPTERTLKSGIRIVDFDAEITGLRSADGSVLAPTVRHVRMELVWGPDLPGGHHPEGRLFISSLTVEPAARGVAELVLSVCGVPELAWLSTSALRSLR